MLESREGVGALRVNMLRSSSRYPGLWVAMECVTKFVESGSSTEIDADRFSVAIADDFVMPEGGQGIRWPDTWLAQEAHLYDFKWYTALAYSRVNQGADSMISMEPTKVDRAGN